jgi:hypothetical protein
MSEDFQSSKQRTRHRTILAGIGVGIVILALIGIRMFDGSEGSDPHAPVAKIVEKSGRVLIDTRDGNLPYQPEMLVHPAYILRTEKGGRMTVAYLDDATRMQIMPKSFIQIDSNAEGKRLEVQGGRIEITVAPQPKDNPMRLDTAISEALVLKPGSFRVSYVGLKAHYEAEKGKIRVRRLSDGNSTVVGAGETHVCKPEGSGKIEFGNIDTSFGD